MVAEVVTHSIRAAAEKLQRLGVVEGEEESPL
jgi:hypothetical protein